MTGLARPPAGGRDSVEERIQVRRYLDALRRNVFLIGALVLLATGTVFVVSLSMQKTYEATARIVFEQPTFLLGQNDSESVKRRLATTELLLTSATVLDKASKKLGGADVSVDSFVDEAANIIYVVGRSDDPEQAAATANAVSSVFLTERVKLERRRLARSRETLKREITELESRPGSSGEAGAIRERLSDLGVSEASAGQDLQIAERATPPASSTSPKPVRNAVVAFFAALFAGVLIALARDQLVPRFNSTRELAQGLELPVLTSVPYVRRRLGAAKKGQELGGIEDEAYGTLRATLEFSSGDSRVLLVTSALHGEGKTTATARLGRALARAGHRTLLVSGDLRVPRLHEAFGQRLGLGLAEILAVLDREPTTNIAPDFLERATQVVIAPAKGRRRDGCLHLITSGTKIKDPGQLVSSHAMRTFLGEVRKLDYDYILVDAPPLLGVADSQVLSQWTDTMLIVCRLDRITVDRAAELREVLDRLGTQPLGALVIGVSGDSSPYLTTRRAPVADLEAGASA